MSDEARLLALRAVDGAAEYLARARARAGAVPDGARDPALIRKVGVLGAGAMGRGIAMAFVKAGCDVVLVDPVAAALSSSRAHLTAMVDRLKARGDLDQATHSEMLARLSYAGRVEAFTDAELVVEAVPEALSLKQAVMEQIETVVSSGSLITSNTSTLDVDALAGALTRPGRFLGTHFFMPAQINPLLELVPARTTTPETLGTVLALAKRLDKAPVIAANGDGFIGNRLFDRFYFEAMYLVEEGAWPEDVDAALEAWGFTIGPFRALDMVGNDIPWGVVRQRAERPNPPHHPRLFDAVCEAGLFGKKTGRGWYLYDSETPKGRPHEQARGLAEATSRDLGRTRRDIGPDEIVGRCLTALMLEGLMMLHEGRVTRATDIDHTYVTGYGFPASAGGPMRMAEELGTGAVLDLAGHYGALSGRGDTAWAIPADLTQGE